jgi:hypothetical protein
MIIGIIITKNTMLYLIEANCCFMYFGKNVFRSDLSIGSFVEMVSIC